MKLKTMEVQIDGKPVTVAVVQNGNPIYVHDDGKEVEFDAPAAVAKVGQVSDDRDTWRTKTQAAETAAKAFEGVDLEKAKQALQVVANIETGKLKDANEVQRLKDEVAAGYTTRIATLEADHKTALDKLTVELHEEKIGNAFAGSKYVNERLAIPPAVARSYFGPHLQVKDGKVVTTVNGQPLMSKTKPGEYADIEEGLEHLTLADPSKDKLLVGAGATGGGANPGQLLPQNGTFVIDRERAKDPAAYRAAKEAAQKAGMPFEIAQ